MTLNGQRQFRRPHAMTIIGDADEALATFAQFDDDAGGTRIDTIFDQFLHHRGGPFNDLTGGDLVDEIGW